MNRPAWALAPALVSAVAGCGADESAEYNLRGRSSASDIPFPDSGSSDIPVPEAYSDCRASEGAGTELGAPAVSGDELTMEASYSGGCAMHEFQICWDGAFAESEPVQVRIEIWHDANGDTCEAVETQTLAFDLSPLKQAWQDAYQQSTGTITINTAGGAVAYAF